MLRIILLSALYFHICLSAQEPTSEFRYHFEPPEVIIRLDTTLLKKNKNSVLLTPGDYRLRVWAPQRELMDTTLILTENEVLDFNYTLKAAASWSQSQMSNRKLKNKNFVISVLHWSPVALAGGYLFADVLPTMSDLKDRGKELDMVQKEYDDTSFLNIDEREFLVAKYNGLQESYEDDRKAQITESAIVFSACTALFFIVRKAKKQELITPGEEKPLLSRIEIGPSRKFDTTTLVLKYRL